MIAAFAKIVCKINVMFVSASYGSFEHHARYARNHFGEKFSNYKQKFACSKHYTD